MSHFLLNLGVSVVIGLGGVLGGETSTQDLSTVRAALDRRYDSNRDAFLATDSSAVMRLRHPDFHTIDVEGGLHVRSEFAARTRLLLEAIVRFDTLSFHIDSLEVRGDTAIAVVRQRTARWQRLGDGEVHFVQTGVVQREWWLLVREEWLMWRVDRVRPDPVWVDGRPSSP
jgi:hypothetical protein